MTTEGASLSVPNPPVSVTATVSTSLSWKRTLRGLGGDRGRGIGKGKG